MDSEILYADNHLIIVNKPPFIASQPDQHHPKSIVDDVKPWLAKRDIKAGPVFLHPVHRLDLPTSGVLVLAKTSKALSRMNEFFRSDKVKKTYWALVEGVFNKDECSVENWLVKQEYKSVSSPEATENAKKAKMKIRCLGGFERYSFLEIELETGRYHQIRCQLSDLGYPILGDRKYGASSSFSKGIALHHVKWQGSHPILDLDLEVIAFPHFFPKESLKIAINKINTCSLKNTI